MKRFLSAVTAMLVLLSMLVPLCAAAAENPVPKAKQAVVRVAAGIYFEDGQVYTYTGKYFWGTAFGVWAENGNAQVFATNAHVVSDENNKVYDFVYICIDGADLRVESSLVKCEILYVDQNIDVAIIKASAPIGGVGTLPLLRPEELQTGDGVFALGFPSIADKAADSNHFTAEDITVTDGIISRYLTSNGVECMAHTATVNHGNSGGPLIDTDGNAIGINTFILADQSTADLRCYAIYIDYVMEAMDQLGISYTEVSKEDAVPPPEAPNATEAPQAPQAAAPSAEESTEPDATETQVTEPVKKKSPVVPIIIGVVVAAAAAVVVVLVIRKKKTEGSRTVMKQPVLSLYAVSGSLQGQSWALRNVVTIGRDPNCTVVYPADTRGISRNHCRIDCTNGQILITDQGSTYGTFVGGRKLPPNTPVAITPNVEIWLGGDAIRMIIR